MNPVTRAAFLGIALGYALVLAQSSNPYVGTWSASYQNASGKSRQGTVVVSEQGGTWDMDVASRDNPCTGRSVPIEVQRATSDDLVFAIRRSKALPGCKDGLAAFKRVDDRTLEGTFDNRFAMKLIRK